MVAMEPATATWPPTAVQVQAYIMIKIPFCSSSHVSLLWLKKSRSTNLVFGSLERVCVMLFRLRESVQDRAFLLPWALFFLALKICTYRKVCKKMRVPNWEIKKVRERRCETNTIETHMLKVGRRRKEEARHQHELGRQCCISRARVSLIRKEIVFNKLFSLMTTLWGGSLWHYDTRSWMLFCKADVLNCTNDLLQKNKG